MTSLQMDSIKFKDIERTFFEIGCEIARELMTGFLNSLDKEL